MSTEGVEGASLDQAAERRGVALATARGQLKAIFAKTETQRQGELVQHVLTAITASWDVYEAADHAARRLPSSETTPE